MKKLVLILLCCWLLCACGKTAPKSEGLPTVLMPSEYVLYTNIFYNQTGEDYVGDTFQKVGVYTRIYDAFNGRERYYVWGYKDATKCCDWQWEFVPAQGAELPSVGSQVEVTDAFAGSENALDGYWIEDAAIQVRTPYAAPATDIALTTMSDTLERVQLLNIQYKPEEFEGKDVYFYGRVSGPGVIEDPYYDGSWTQKIESADELPAIGTIVIVHGTVKDGVVTAATITPTEEY